VTGRHTHLLRAALGASDVAAAVGAALAAYALRFHALAAWVPVTGRTDVLPARYLSALPVAVLLLLLATAAAGLYDPRRAPRAPGVADILRLAGLSVAALATVALLYWQEFQYSRGTLFLAGALYAPLFAGLRTWSLARLRRRVAPPALVVGGGAPARALERAIAESDWPVARVDAVLAIGDDVAWADVRRIRDVDAACDELARGTWRDVFVAVPTSHADSVHGLLRRLEQTTAAVHLVPDLGAALLVHPNATVVSGLPLVSLRERPLYGLRAAAKRTLDVLGAALLLVLLAPLLVVLALVVRCTSPGPVLYAQERMGMDGRPFRMLKFRTMRPGAEDATGPVFARPGDPRVTAAGRLLRRFSLDELPQLWNVLLGDMSLVGPRPERATFIEEFRRRLPGYMLRHSVKAGMTGWAQVHGLRGESSLEDRLRYDLEYVDRWTLSLDLVILGRTAVQVLVGRNAY
jgi:exopolysaccharide biosynthesis polyprenyl glycosylphosphotransferase